MLRASTILLLVAALLAPAAPAAARCAPQVVTHQIVSHAADLIPSSGGVLVGWDAVSYNDASEVDGDPAARSSWRFRLGKKNVATTMTVLAPGLAMYRPTKVAKGSSVRYALVGDGGAKLGTYKFGSSRPKALIAPRLSGIATSTSSKGRSTSHTTTVTLSAAPPSNAYGVVVRAAGGEAFTWGKIVDKSSTSIVVYAHDGRCGRVPEGMRAPTTGESIEVLFVDKFGRLSPASSAVTAK